jgi:hypothetical protein
MSHHSMFMLFLFISHMCDVVVMNIACENGFKSEINSYVCEDMDQNIFISHKKYHFPLSCSLSLRKIMMKLYPKLLLLYLFIQHLSLSLLLSFSECFFHFVATIVRLYLLSHVCFCVCLYKCMCVSE